MNKQIVAAEAAYLAYTDALGLQTTRVSWEKLPANAKNAWRAVVEAVRKTGG